MRTLLAAVVLLLVSISAHAQTKPIKNVKNHIRELYPVMVFEALGEDPYFIYFNPNVSPIEGGLLVPMAAYFPKRKEGYLYRTILNCEKRTLNIEEMTSLPVGKVQTLTAGVRDIPWKSPASYVALKVCNRSPVALP